MDIYDANGSKVGYVKDDGSTYNVHGHKLGEVTQNGWVNAKGIPVGFVFSEGHINTIRGEKVGEVSSKGTVQDEKGTPIGKVDVAGDFLLATGGAALLFLLTEENNYGLS